MNYRTMNRKELAIELGVSYSTLNRRIKKMDPVFRKQIKGDQVLFEEQVRYIHENIDLRKRSEIGLGKDQMKKLKEGQV
ncbi:hypothetical protein [Marinifilum caeruleilacunae]|uniref:DNA binding HTH domain-containing protein n=1 Tax=Marinifilum caeruleilacunae TaxID=2499076 RepID=A0ABX1WXJ9_9BACT|nr:hypothetical protein [Marinifilum caeruleilacunae]NOU60817.1 hypothetical protein [Marinifilum caeruleilacunae]